MADRESDIDFAVLFRRPPQNSLKTYAALSLDLQDLATPFRADLLSSNEVDHLIQLEAIKESVSMQSTMSSGKATKRT